jgi:hypothetical protein
LYYLIVADEQRGFPHLGPVTICVPLLGPKSKE